MTLRGAVRAVLGATAAMLAGATAHAQDPSPGDPPPGPTFQCEDGGKLVLSFTETGSGIAALVWLRGATYELPYIPPEPGPAQVVWSDGEHSLTWSPGVRLMWMSRDTHLMCGRGGHSH
jgi:hypothetical protein